MFVDCLLRTGFVGMLHVKDSLDLSGPILAQTPVRVLESDTSAVLHERIQQAERVLYPETIGAISMGTLKIEGRKSSIMGR